MAEILYPVSVTKQHLKDMLPLLWTLNRAPLRIGDISYPAGAVVFKGFAGRLHVDTGLYHGNYLWRDSQASDSERDAEDHNGLAGLDVPITCQSECTDMHDDDVEINDGG